jgi:hypothetical protein
MLSAYTNNPLNLAINSPSGEVKNYVLRKVAENFPKEDVIFLAGMTDKALFHKQGILVTKNNESGEYEPIDHRLEQIDSEIEDKEYEMKFSTHKNDQKALLKVKSKR